MNGFGEPLRRRTPLIEERMDELGVLRQPRVALLPGLWLPADLVPGALLPLSCPLCGSVERWWFRPWDALIVCECRVKWVE